MLQATNIVHPDASSTFTDFYLTGELKKTWGSRSYPVEYTYDFAGRMKTMKTWQSFASASGAAITTWNYHPQGGWLLNKRYQDNSGPDYTYTSGGRLKTRSWARTGTGSQRILATYTYGFDDAAQDNEHGELVSVAYSNDPLNTPGVAYTYDRLGRQTAATQGSTTTTFLRGLAGQLLSESYSGGPLSGLRITNRYDQYLRRTNVATLNSQLSTLNSAGYSYDTASHLQTVTSGDISASYSYLANSPLVEQVSFKQGANTRMITTKSYDRLNRLSKISSAPSASSAVSFEYSYNPASQRTRATLADGSYWLYEYDRLGQVISGKKYWSDGTPVAGQQFEYGFDDIGNRTGTKAGGDENGANLRSASYSPNLLNQYTNRTVPGYADIMGVSFATNTVTVNGQTAYRKGEYFRKELPVANSTAVSTNITVSATGQSSVTGSMLVAKASESFWHDADGNLLSDSLWTNRWNVENRLVHVESTTAIPANKRMRETWTHLPDGRWIERIVSTNNGSAYYPAFTNRFVWDGQVLMAILDHTNGLVMSFVRGLDLSGSIQGAGGVGGVLAVVFKTNGTHFVSYDGNGNVVALADTNGTINGQFEYGPFSEPIRVTGTAAQQMPLRFSTMYEDSVTGDRKYLFRDLNPSTGRWKSRDPIEEEGSANVYGFLANSSIDKTDLLGLAFYAIGGTWESEEDQANPWWLYRQTLETPRRYFPGPNLTGTKSPDIAFRVYDQIVEDFCKAKAAGEEFTVNLTGWSRGAVIAVQVASLLNDLGAWCNECWRLTHYEPVPVNWIGVFDAVSRMPPRTGLTWSTQVPSNVAHFDHAIKTDTRSAKQRLFPTVQFAGRNINARAFYTTDGGLTTHADIGESKKRGNNGAYDWVKGQAISAGVKF